MAAHILPGKTAAAPLICIKRRLLSEEPAPPPESKIIVVSHDRTTHSGFNPDFFSRAGSLEL
jgi:hypothetical protein